MLYKYNKYSATIHLTMAIHLLERCLNCSSCSKASRVLKIHLHLALCYESGDMTLWTSQGALQHARSMTIKCFQTKMREKARIEELVSYYIGSISSILRRLCGPSYA